MPQSKLEELAVAATEFVKQAFGANLVALVQYRWSGVVAQTGVGASKTKNAAASEKTDPEDGGAATSSASSERTDMSLGLPLDLLLVLDFIDAQALEQIAEFPAELAKANLVRWQILKASELAESTDVFPDMFLEMKRNYRLLAGEDVLASLDIRQDHLRLRCEQLFKQLLNDLQLDLLHMTAGHHQRLKSRFQTLMQLSGTALWLLGIQPPARTNQLMKIAAEALSMKPDVISSIQASVAKHRLSKRECRARLIEFVQAVRDASKFLDGFGDEVIVVESDPA